MYRDRKRKEYYNIKYQQNINDYEYYSTYENVPFKNNRLELIETEQPVVNNILYGYHYSLYDQTDIFFSYLSTKRKNLTESCYHIEEIINTVNDPELRSFGKNRQGFKTTFNDRDEQKLFDVHFEYI